MITVELADAAGQLPLAIDVAAAPVPHGPGLDAETIRRLKAIDITYVCTKWSPWFKHWYHLIEFDSGRGVRRLTKVDEGIAAMLRDGETS